MSALPDCQTAAPHGAFTSEMLAAHLAALGHLPKWWLDLKREAWNRFAALPLPQRTNELWRFSNVAGLKLDGYTLPALADLKFQISNLKFPSAAAFPQATTLAFANNRALPREALPANLREKGVLFEPIETALVDHADLFRQHFMAQPVNLGSEKFAALNAALTTSGAFLYVPRDVELAQPLAVTHVVAGAGSAVFPHTLVILGDNAKATLVENFLSADPADAGFVTGVNDLPLLNTITPR